MIRRRTKPGNRPTSVAGRLGGGLFFSVFLGMGLLFGGMLTMAVYDAVKTRFWTETACTIAHSEVVDAGNDGYGVKIAFDYTWFGDNYHAETYQLNPQTEGDYRDAALIVAEHPVGCTATCLVNEEEPSEAVLAHGSPWIGVFIIIPLVFVAIGGAGLYGTIWGWKRKANAPEAVERISEDGSSKRTPVVIGLLFGGVFVVAGIAMCYFLGVRPVWQSLAANAWPETPCAIVSSRIASRSDDDGTTYRPDVLYEYEVDGRPYRSNRYSFGDVFTSGYEGKKEIVRRYAKGSESVCWVNPNDPTDSVLERGLVANYLWGLFGLPFLIAGAAVMWGVARSGRRQAGGGTLHMSSDWFPKLPADRPPPIELSSVTGRWSKLVLILVFCVIWNTIVGLFITSMGIIAFPFALVGVGLICAVVYFSLAVTNPLPRITVDRQVVALGDTIDLDWGFSGDARKFTSLRISLIGREEARYQRGTTTCTDKNVFSETILAQVEHPSASALGSVKVTIPADAMHSFESSNNKIVWRIVVRGDIPRWPDVKDEFPLFVLPPEYVS